MMDRTIADEQFLVIPTPLLPSLFIGLPVIRVAQNMIKAKYVVSVEVSHEMLSLSGTVREMQRVIEDEVIMALRDAMLAAHKQYHRL